MILIAIFEDLVDSSSKKKIDGQFFSCSLRSECSITLLSPFRAAFHSRSLTFPFFPSRQLLSSNRDRFSTLIVGSRAKEGLSSARKRNTRPVYFAKNNNHFSALLVARGLERFYLFDSRTAPRLFKIIYVETR